VDLIIAYDVNTLTKEGRSRLRRVARVCEGYGQRVQESLFECRVNETQREKLRQRLTKIIEPAEDSLRVYQLRGGREGAVESLGLDRYVSFTDTLIG
jgi:CRISPR-associated protein Cas2